MSKLSKFEEWILRSTDCPDPMSMTPVDLFEAGRTCGMAEAAEIIKAADEAFTTYEESFSYAEEQIRQRMEGK